MNSHFTAKIFLFFSLILSFNLAFSEPFKIGIPVPLSGATQIYGEEIRRGYELGKELLKADDIELIFENDECNPTKSIAVAKKLIEIDRVKTITGTFCNSTLFATAPIYNRVGIPVLTCGANPGDKKGIGKKIFRLFPADHLGVSPLVKYISKETKKLCVISEIDAYTELVSRTLKSEWKNLGPDYTLYDEEAHGGELDFRSILLRLKQRQCDGLFINSMGDDGYIAAYKQARSIAFPGKMYAYYMPGSSGVQKALGESLNGVVYATLPTNDALTTELGKKFQNLYHTRYGDFQVALPLSMIAFESLRLILEARDANIPLDTYLKGRVIKNGAISEYSFDADGALQGMPFRIVKYDQGKEINLN